MCWGKKRCWNFDINEDFGGLNMLGWESLPNFEILKLCIDVVKTLTQLAKSNEGFDAQYYITW
jgi:hypothetical protein